MKYEVYEQEQITKDYSVFDFYSEGVNGSILKRVTFKESEYENVYNLAFGCVDEKNDIDDLSISDNGDLQKILATVAQIVKIYTAEYPERWINFEGSTKSRTRLYRMAITLNFEELSEEFLIFGISNDKPIPFSKNMDTPAFLIKRKK